MNHPLISIIIPIYNAETLLSRAVDSTLKQHGCAFEVILVDDGSRDNSGKLCDEYAAAHPNVRVVHKENGGLSSARNAGIHPALGEYLMFLDADDYLAEDTCAELAAVIRDHKPDFIDFGWNYVNSVGEITSNLHKLPKNTRLGEDVIHGTVLPPLLNLKRDNDHFIFDFAWNKVYRRDIILNNQVFFDEGRRTWEDRPFVVSYLRYCTNMYSVDRCFYYYVDVAGSLSRKYSLDFFRIIIENFQLYKSLYGNEYDFDTQYVNNHWSKSVENVIFRSLDQTENRDVIRDNTLSYLRHPQIVYWFAHSNHTLPFRIQLSALIADGKAEEALRLCEKEHAALSKKPAAVSIKQRLRAIVKKIIGR